MPKSDPLAKARWIAQYNAEVARGSIPRAQGFGGARPVTEAEERDAYRIVDKGAFQPNATTRVTREGRIPHTLNRLMNTDRQWAGDEFNPTLTARVMRSRGVFETWIRNLPRIRVLLNGEREVIPPPLDK